MYVLIYCLDLVGIGISLALHRKLDIISTALPMITKAEAKRRLGISKFPLPDNSDDELLAQKK